jgi:hypothetical protein
VADDEIEDGVAQELEALVVGATGVGVLVAPGAVAEGGLEEAPLGEGVADQGLQGVLVVAA